MRHMRIRPKVVLALAALIAVLIAVEIVDSGPRDIAELRRARTRGRSNLDAPHRLRARSQHRRTRIDAADWSDWGELFQFMQNRNQKFLDTYTTPVAMAPLKVDMLLVADLRTARSSFHTRAIWRPDRRSTLDLAERSTLARCVFEAQQRIVAHQPGAS
jgi:sensor domain CHASE-containing protein